MTKETNQQNAHIPDHALCDSEGIWSWFKRDGEHIVAHAEKKLSNDQWVRVAMRVDPGMPACVIVKAMDGATLDVVQSREHVTLRWAIDSVRAAHLKAKQ